MGSGWKGEITPLLVRPAIAAGLSMAYDSVIMGIPVGPTMLKTAALQGAGVLIGDYIGKVARGAVVGGNIPLRSLVTTLAEPMGSALATPLLHRVVGPMVGLGPGGFAQNAMEGALFSMVTNSLSQPVSLALGVRM